jgi:ATP-dependent DNA ligase
LLRATTAPAYVAFDLLWLNGTDVRPLPLSERRRLLQSMLPVKSRADKNDLRGARETGGRVTKTKAFV